MIQSVQHLLLLRQNSSLHLLWWLLLHRLLLLLPHHIIWLLNHVLPHLWLLHSVRRSHLICRTSKAVCGLFKSRTKLHLLLVAWRRQHLRWLLLEGCRFSETSIHLWLLLVWRLIEIHRLLLLVLLLLLGMLLLLLDQLILRVRRHPHSLPTLHRIHIRVHHLILLELMLLNLLLLRMSLSERVQWRRRLLGLLE